MLERLAVAILEARGDSSQREFAEVLGVAQTAVHGWENRKNYPNLRNLEKIARVRNQLPEEFVAYLYGRDRQSPLEAMKQQIAVMSCPEIGEISRAIADRLAGI